MIIKKYRSWLTNFSYKNINKMPLWQLVIYFNNRLDFSELISTGVVPKR